MPGYIPNVLQKFQHKPPEIPKMPHIHWIKTVYGKQIQLATQKISASKLNSMDTNRAQSINGTFLYYASALYPTIIPAINNISSCQYVPTQNTLSKWNQVFDYASMHTNATIWCHASGMIIITDTYAAYIFLPTYRSCIAGHYSFTNRMPDFYNYP